MRKQRRGMKRWIHVAELCKQYGVVGECAFGVTLYVVVGDNIMGKWA